MAPLDEPALASPAVAAVPGSDAPAVPGTPLRQRHGLLTLYVAALALLLASFPARNSDLWMNLAAGRLLRTEGRFSFGTDLSFPPGLQVQHAWLYNSLAYGLYTAFGGPGLVLVKALLVVGLALVLLRLSRTGTGWGLPAACTALALLAMSTRLLLQPATISYLLLALTLLIEKKREEEAGVNKEQSASSFALFSLLPPLSLLVLFVLWANLDSWFVLGLVVVALLGLGRTLDEAAAGRRPALGRRAVALAFLAAACLLNPAHVGAFALPAELGWSGPAGSPAGPLAAEPVTSPFQKAYLTGVGLSPAGLAWFPLLGLGLISFVLNVRGWRWQRFLPWLALALLSAVQVRTVPFFAVVAGPVLAWNLQEVLARRFGPQWQPSRLGQDALVGGRVLAVMLAAACLVCAWPGWLQAPPFEPRRWAVETAPSLERGAAATRRWHQEGKLGPDARALHLARETASAFAWFCPEEKGLLDERLAAAVLGDAGADEDWAERMRAAGVNHLILYNSDRGRLFTALDGLLADPEQWPLLYLEGDLAVFGWRDPAGAATADPFRGWELDLERLAFHPTEAEKAPRRRPAREPEVRNWWDAFWKPSPPRPLDRDEATLHLLHAEALRRTAPQRHLAAWEASQLGALVGAAGGWTGPADLLDAHRRLVLFQPGVPQPGFPPDALPAPDRMALAFQEMFPRQRDDMPPALLYLAVRAARRALAASPDDAQAHLVLGESYLRLLRNTRERAWAARMPELAQLRRAQASAALNQAVTLKPNFAQAHLSLAGLYREVGYLDLTLEHLRTYLQLTREAGAPAGVGAEQFRAQVTGLEEEVGRLAKEVEARTNAHAVKASGARVQDRAQLAVKMGLAGKARDLLLESDVAAFGPQGVMLELGLLLETGRTREVREWTDDEQKAALGASPYHMLRIQALAAAGDYALAEEECTRLARAVTQPDAGREPVPIREMMALMVAQTVLDEQPGQGFRPDQYRRAFARVEFHLRVAELARSLRREAEVTVLRGLLLLEEGDVEEAEVAFRVALALWQDEATAAANGGLDFAGRPAAQGYLALLAPEG